MIPSSQQKWAPVLRPERRAKGSPLRDTAILAAMVLAFAGALHIAAQALTGMQTCRIEQLPQCPGSNTKASALK